MMNASTSFAVVMVVMMIVMCGGMILAAGFGIRRWARRQR
jgi:hypothetical protein